MRGDKSITKRWTRAQGKANRVQTAACTGLGVLATFVAIGQGWALASTITAVLTQTYSKAGPWIGVYLALAVSRTVLAFLQDIAAIRAGASARRRILGEVLQRVINSGPGILRTQHSATIAGLIVDRIQALDGYFARWVPASALWLILQWLVVLCVYVKNHQAGLILALCCLSLPVFQAVFGIATGIESRRQFIAMTRLQTRFLDRVKGIATIVLSGATEREAQALAQGAEELRGRTMRVLRIAFIASATTDIALVAALVLIVVTQAHSLSLNAPSSTLTSALFAILMVPEAFAPFRVLSAAYQDQAHATAAAEAMHKLPDAETTQRTQKQLLSSDQRCLLTVDNVSFAWADGLKPVFQDLSFSLRPGEMLILEGESGAGKSTLLELLLGFIAPQSGRVLINGIDLQNLAPRDVSNAITWIGQKPVLFAGTIRDNIMFARPDASEEDLNNALNLSAVEQYLPTLPKGLDTQIGEGGHGLSGGQAQRVAIARAYLKNAPILLLDEPTAHLDPATELDILESLKRLSSNRTVIMSTHSKQGKDLSNKHLLLGNGQAQLIQDGKA
ncbi:transport ATP-binding protein CydD [Neokomagataea thailandica NBRC 106555]|uniref:Thiol reductant ABC exporter subunit CydD n=2 Tax=Neokomagataea TaxID=1223423 RepID=A0A4Y6VAG7_9PROT|nr:MULTISPECIES: thiol reductant ABC exporter subunit CydD [Neokomagataea]QDH25690.1 thiol reductant ABC exporter subunit CydD [Neokomagataea tanensis]GBR54403.1 transport ATP-binding protein CydD [Neokomagataea thailandica NBRC 106555]